MPAISALIYNNMVLILALIALISTNSAHYNDPIKVKHRSVVRRKPVSLCCFYGDFYESLHPNAKTAMPTMLLFASLSGVTTMSYADSTNP